jgi:hypothetical protein
MSPGDAIFTIGNQLIPYVQLGLLIWLAIKVSKYLDAHK